MATVSDLRLELDDATTLRLISSAFTEASAARIQKIKRLFETNKQFYDEISHVYHLVRVSKSVSDEVKKKIEPPKKTLSVAVTSNQRFYGSLNVNVMHSFIDAIQSIDTDVLVIGTTGHDLIHSNRFSKRYDTLSFAHDNPTTDETRTFLDKTTPYEKVIVHFPKFVTLVTQVAGNMDITQAVSGGSNDPEDEVHILFEPEYQKILEFFQRQVRSLLFLHVMLESDLSRTAARLIAMSGAEDRSDKLIKQKSSELRKIQASIANAKLLETFAGITKWKK